MGHSLQLSLLTASIATLIGVPLGILLGKTDLPLRGSLTLLLTAPLLIPPYVLAVAWFSILGRTGVLGGILPDAWSQKISSEFFGLRVESGIATWLLHRSVPVQAKARTNPLANDPAEIAAGSDLFRQKCEICHAYDGGGKTEIGSGEYPRPPVPFYGRHINVGWRDFLSHPQWHQKHRHAGLATARPATLAACRFHSSSARSRATYDEASHRRPRGCGSFRAICRLGRLPKMP
jgi:hypothetical protein